ncbi:MAG: hypothetical protein HC817_07405 [Saprospiraceae bacterium]|nr:hypothetical protein [Saprospiraceae bacterium]
MPPAIGWGIFVFVLSVWPGKDFPKIEDWFDLFSVDKVVHMVFYALLTWLILRGYVRVNGLILQKDYCSCVLWWRRVVLATAGFGVDSRYFLPRPII